MLASIPQPTRLSAVDRNKPLAAALSHFLKLKSEGSTNVSLQWFYQNKLQARFNGPSITTVRLWASRL